MSSNNNQRTGGVSYNMPDKLVLVEIIEDKIYNIRNQLVMIDSDLALLYDVTTKVLNQSVKRNINRFPQDFMFQLTDEEWEVLRSQIVTSKESKGGRRYNPYVFTEHGILMLSNVINSERAINVSIQVVRIFNKLKKAALTHIELAEKIASIELQLKGHEENFEIVFHALKQLIEAPEEPEEPQNPIGFR